MPFNKKDLFATLLLLVLSHWLAISAIACDVRDIPLGEDRGRVSEQIGDDDANDRNSGEDNTAGRGEETGGIGGSAGEGRDSQGGWDTQHDNEYKDAERRDGGSWRDSGSGNGNGTFDASIQFEVCGSTFCLPGSVCCASCGFCVPAGEPCPQDCYERIQPTDYCQPIECGAPPGRAAMACPIGTIGGPMCIRTDNGTCTWQIVPCTSPTSKPCGESIDSECGSFEYCDAPQCGEGTNTGFCQLRPMGCSDEYEPVCGCDGNEYSNFCLAHEAGTNVAQDGRCQ